MALYRETATGFVQEWATNPGSGYTAITSQPTDTIDNKVAWWRALDTFSQTSEWHPSLPGTPEYAGPDTRSGSGINIMPSDYASFEWAGSAPPTYTANATVARSTAYKYHGTYGLRYSISALGGLVGFGSSSSIYNITINPNGKWIVSAYVRPVDNAVRNVSLQLTTTAGNTYTVTGNTLNNNASWVRINGVFDLSADASTTARMAISLSATGVQVDIDAIMLEEKVGPLSTPSTFNSPWGTGITTEQYPDYGIPQTKLYQDLGARIDLIDGAAGVEGTVNARIKTEADARTSADSAISSTVTTLIASVNTNSAAIQTESTARATADSALATNITTVQTTVDGHTASIQSQAQSINGLQASFFVKTDVNGYVAGFGIFNNGPGESGFLVRADKFAIGFPGNSNRIPFYVDSTGTYIYDAFIRNLSADKINAGTLSADRIGANTITVGKLSFTPLTAGGAAGDINAYSTTIDGSKITTGTLNANRITAGTITTSQLSFSPLTAGGAAGDINSYGTTIDGSKITTGTLNANRITAGTITADRLNFSPLTAGGAAGDINTYGTTIDGSKITTGTLNANRITAGTITADRLNFTTLAAGQAANDINTYGTQIDGARIQTGTLYADRIVGGTITADKLVVNGITTDRIGANQVTKMVGGSVSQRSTYWQTYWDDHVGISCNGGDILASVCITLNGSTEATFGYFTLYINGSYVDYKTAIALPGGSSSVTVLGYYVGAPTGNVDVYLHSQVDNNSNNGGTWSASYYAINGKR